MPVSKVKDFDAEERQYAAAKMAEVRHIRQRFAADIIAKGIFTSDDLQTEVISTIADADADIAAALKSLSSFFERPGVDRQISCPLEDDAKHTDWASDVATGLTYKWGEAGFLVGLAVGMQLGPHAFDGVEAKSAMRRGAR